MFKLDLFISKHFKAKKTLSLVYFNLLLACWLGLGLNYRFYQKIYVLTPYSHVKAVGLVIASILIVIAAYNLVLQLLSWRINAKIFAVLLLIVGGLSAYFVNSLGVLITADQIQNLLQTDIQEVADLWSIQMIIWSLIFIALPMRMTYKFHISHQAWIHTIKHKLISSLASIVLIVALLFSFYVDYAAIFREHRDLKTMLSPQNSLAALNSYYKDKAPKTQLPLIRYGTDAHLLLTNQTTVPPKLLVLVVGETARAESFALNGYSRPTNPKLSQLDVINFNRVSACGTATAVSVPCMFSGMPRQDYDEQLASHREGLLDIAQRAGYQVTWIDNNSGCKGVCSRVTQYQIPEKLKQKWCDTRGECLDDILVDSLNAYLRDLDPKNTQPQLIVLHQMGSHGPAYYKRSTASYQPFQPMCNSNAIQGCSATELKNAYDNSIVYTDHVLAQVIATLQHQTHYQSAFWYLSDHGESTGEHGLYLHGAPYAIAPTQQTHVPMMMWFSKAWQHSHTTQVTCLKQQVHNTFSQDNLFPSLLSLLDIKSQVIDHKHDMLSQCTSVMPSRV